MTFAYNACEERNAFSHYLSGDIMFVQIFEVVLNTEFDVVVTIANKSINLHLDGNELDQFILSLNTDTVIEYGF